jgi:hypothetical protein
VSADGVARATLWAWDLSTPRELGTILGDLAAPEHVSRPLAELGGHTPDGVPVLALEIALLYTLAAPMPKAKADFVEGLSSLGRLSRSWLHHALRSTYPSHPALPLLAS